MFEKPNNTIWTKIPSTFDDLIRQIIIKRDKFKTSYDRKVFFLPID